MPADGSQHLEEPDWEEEERQWARCIRRRAEREAAKKREEEARQAAELARQEEALDAAFDGDLEILEANLEAGVDHECQNQHGDTLLSEAATGGALAVVRFLLGLGANPNSIGRYGRTPLWRAAWAGHLDVGRALLRAGGDPRVPDEQGVLPIKTCSKPDFRALLACWDTSSTDEQRTQANQARRSSLKRIQQEEEAKKRQQCEEMEQSVTEAERKLLIAQAEVASQTEMLRQHISQKADVLSCGAAGRAAEVQQAAERCEATLQETKQIQRESEWQLQRARLKRRDWETAEAQRNMKHLGKAAGFRVELVLAAAADLEALMAKLSQDLELQVDVTNGDGVVLKRGDVLRNEGVLLEGSCSKEQMALVEIEEWPVSIWFNHGFDTTIRIAELSDVLIKDVGGRRYEDGRCMLVVDPSGSAATFAAYSGATVFSVPLLQESMDDEEVSLRVRHALLSAFLHGLPLFVDLLEFDFALETLREPIDHLELGLFGRLTDRSALFSYLLPRRFAPLITNELKDEFPLQAFDDEALAQFALIFVTAYQEPPPELAQIFYTVRVRND